MKALVYLAGVATIFDGILHLLFPDRWDALWMAGMRRISPGLGQVLDQWYHQQPAKRRMQGLGWILLGALILTWVGSVETTEV